MNSRNSILQMLIASKNQQNDNIEEKIITHEQPKEHKEPNQRELFMTIVGMANRKLDKGEKSLIRRKKVRKAIKLYFQEQFDIYEIEDEKDLFL